MIRWIVETSIRLRFLIIILAAVFLAFGISELQKMPVAVFPEFDPPLVEVQTEALGLSAEEVESLITVPMEADLLNGVAWVDQFYSESVAGLSSILITFEPGTDPIRARQMVQERLTQAHALPNVSKPPVMLQPLSSSKRVMMVGLASDELSLIDLGVLARWTIKPRLLGVPGVANVAVWGQRERQLQVQVDPARLHAADVTLKEIIETTGEALWVSPLTFLEASSPGTAGWIDTPNQRLSIRHLLPISTPDELAQVAVVGKQGVLLGDVANVVEDHQPLIGEAMLNETPALILVIEKFPGANTLEVTKGVEAAFEALAPGLTGVQVDTNVFRPASYIELATRNFSVLVLISAVLVLLVLAAFFFEWRTALISLVVIPLSLIAATFVFYLRGATFNTLVLAGLVIALVIIIDDAIIDTENIARRLRQQHRDGNTESAMAIVLGASLETRSAVWFATLILLLAILPVFFLPGLTGLFFQPLAITLVLAILVSLAVALIVTPALSLILMANRPPGRQASPLIQGLRSAYSGLLKLTLRAPTLALIIAVVFIVVGLALIPLLKQQLLPSFKRTHLLIEWEGAPGTSGAAMNRISTQAVRELRAIPGVGNVGMHVGRAETGDAVVAINSGEIWVSLDPTANYDATLAAVQTVIDGYPGLTRQVDTYQPERIGLALSGPNQDFIVRIYGHDLDLLRDKAEEVQQILAGTNGVINAQVDLKSEEPQVEIQPKLLAAEGYGLKPGDVRRQATTLLSGLYVGNLFEEQKVFDVVVWAVPELRHSLSDISGLLIDTPDGDQVPLSEVADIRIAPSPTSIKRHSVSRYVDVGADVSGRSLSAVVADVESRMQSVEVPFEFHIEVLSDTVARQAAQRQMLVIAIAAVIGIFLLLQAVFGSWRLAAVTFLTLPMALSGGVFATLISGGVLSLGSIFGFLALLGIATRNGVVMVNHFQHLMAYEDETFGPELVLRGARERLGPILMTALAAALALLPFVFAGARAGNEIVFPIAVVVLGGLVTSALLTLFILPTLYLRFGPGYLPIPEEESQLLREEPQLGLAS